MSSSKDKLRSSSFANTINPFHARWSGATEGETEEQARQRGAAMERAFKHSKDIDQFLQEGKKALDRRRRAIKILLLGQSESGKSSVLKNFQLAFAPRHFDNERPAWKIVIQLNIIGTIKTILEALQEDCDATPQSPIRGAPENPRSPSRTLRRMRLALSPLFFIEANLLRVLAPESSDSRDMSVRAGRGWRTLLGSGNLPSPTSAEDALQSPRKTCIDPELDPTSILSVQRDEIIGLWTDPSVQEIIKRRRPRLQESPGFFMNDIARIAVPTYVPTDADIIRARIKTLGVEEHRFFIERGRDANHEFIITDVGGARQQRASWAPFFDDVQAILFLAPLVFNQFLEEDSRVNRLEDSIYLWRDLCANKLLANANLILFFNKRDVLASVLASGVRVDKYVTTYDQPNDVASVTRYFREKFRLYHRKMSPEARPFFCYECSAIDIKSMSVLLAGVRESILRQHLREGDML